MVWNCGCLLPIAVLKAAARAKKALSFESRYLLEISSMDPGRRIRMEKTLNSYWKFSKFVLSKYSLPNGIPDHQFGTDLDSYSTFLYQYRQPVLVDLL